MPSWHLILINEMINVSWDNINKIKDTTKDYCGSIVYLILFMIKYDFSFLYP